MKFVIVVVAALPRKEEQRWLQDFEVFFFFLVIGDCQRRSSSCRCWNRRLPLAARPNFQRRMRKKKKKEETGAGDRRSEILRRRGRLCRRRAPLSLPGKAIVEEGSRETTAATWGRRSSHGSVAGRVRYRTCFEEHRPSGLGRRSVQVSSRSS